MPDALGQRFTYRRPQQPPHAREQEQQPDQRRHLVDDVVGVGHPRRKLHHVDAVRLSPGPSFPASPSRVLASNRSAKSTRSASSAPSRLSSSSPVVSSSCRAASAGLASPPACTLAVYALLKVRTISQLKKPPNRTMGISTATASGFIRCAAAPAARPRAFAPAAARRSPTGRRDRPPVGAPAAAHPAARRAAAGADQPSPRAWDRPRSAWRVRPRAVAAHRRPPIGRTGQKRLSAGLCRPLSRSDPLSFALLGQQPLGEVHPLGQLRHVAPHRLELLLERLLVVGELGPHVPLPLTADALGDCPADRRDGEEKQRAASEQEDDREYAFDIHDQGGGARRSGSRSRASRRSVKSRRSSTSARRRLRSSPPLSPPPGEPRTAPCFPAWTASHCSSVLDHPRIHSASAFPMGPLKTTVVPLSNATAID